MKVIEPAHLYSVLQCEEPAELLDVRTGPEYENAHVLGAKLISLHALDAEAYLQARSPGTPLYVICQAGTRAKQAIEQLERAGCGDCVLVDGGTQAWIEAGLPVVSGSSNVLPIMRQVQVVIGALCASSAVFALLLSPWFAILPLLLGCGLLVAGITGKCGLALLLARMPWNQIRSSTSECCVSGK